MNIKKIFLSFVMILLLLVNIIPINVSAQEINNYIEYSNLEKLQYLPEITTDSIIYNNEENQSAKIPNGIPISVRPRQNGTGVDVKVNNIGVDGLDSVTVTVKATGYSNSKSVTYYVPALLGKNFAFNFPMIKCNTVYDVTIKITDGGQTKTLYSKGTLNYSESKLADAKWHRGTYNSRATSIEDHLRRHGSEVSSNNIVDYLNKATSYRGEVISNINKGTASSIYNITTGTGSIPSKKYKHKTNGRYILLSNSGYDIFSFGR